MPRFVVAIIEELTAAIRRVVEANGGPEGFFAALSEEPGGVIFQIAKGNSEMRLSLLGTLEDAQFRSIVLSHIGSDEERNYLSDFLSAFDLWAKASPRDYAWARAQVVPIRPLLINHGIPERVNDVLNCASIMSLDARTEDLRIKSALRLGGADKTLGEPGTLIMSSSVYGFLQTIRIMMRSLELSESERALFKLPKAPNGARLLEQLKAIGEDVARLGKQFEEMVR